MKFFIYLLSILNFISMQLFAQTIELKTIAEAEKNYYSRITSAPPAVQAIDNSDFVYHRCEWNIEPAVHFITGKITTFLIPDIAISTIEFDLASALTVDSIYYHSVALSYSHSSEDVLQINFPGALKANILDSISVFYHGIPVSSRFGSFLTDSHHGIPILSTLSQPYSAKDWWPCKQSLNDKIDSIDVIITTSQNYTAISNGLLTEEKQAGNNKVYHWKHRYPIATYLICLAVTNYAHYSDWVPFNGDTLRVDNYVYPEDIASANAGTKAIIPQIQLYDSLFGMYPFQKEKYGHAQFSIHDGGMEHQTISFVGNWDYELLSHELAHQWFGDQVTCGSWQDVWLNEAFATYLSGLCYQYLSPSYWKPFKEILITSITSKPDGSVRCADTSSVQRIFDARLSYQKGAMVLHQLRWVIGDSAFFTAVKNYLKDPAINYGFAKTSNLKAHFEASSNQDLSWYFNDWYDGQGFPVYHIDWTQGADQVVHITVDQAQSHASVPFFELPLPLQFKSNTRDTLIRINHTFAGQTFSIPLSFQVDQVILDPEISIITPLKQVATSVTDNIMTSQIKISPNPAHNIVTIETNNEPGISFTLTDPTGRQVLAGQLSDKNTTINIAPLAPGIYFLQIEKHAQVFKLVKE